MPIGSMLYDHLRFVDGPAEGRVVCRRVIKAEAHQVKVAVDPETGETLRAADGRIPRTVNCLYAPVMHRDGQHSRDDRGHLLFYLEKYL